MTNPSVLIYSADPRYALTAQTIVSTQGIKGTHYKSKGVAVTILHLTLCTVAAKDG